MPLVRFAVKNEYGLGVEELYKDGVETEDPKAVLDGVAVAGLVGVLRQLGDLAQFAAEVFHGLQEQVASTSSRSRKLVNRVQRIETSLPSIEKAILSQTDHLRFAYTPGSERHAYIRTERNLFICDDLPHFIMDSYEECREPPRLQLLDRFDSGGSGSCLKRYSDPTFFKRASSCSEVSSSEKSQRERKARKIKKRRSWQRSGQLPKSGPNLNGCSRLQFSSTGHGQSSLSHTDSTVDMTFKSDLGDQSDSRGSKDGLDYIECVSRPSISTQHEERKNNRLPSSVTDTEVNPNSSTYLDVENSIASGDKPCSQAVEETVHCSSSATWDELLEIVEPTDVNYEIEDTRQVSLIHSSLHEPEFELVNDKGVNQANGLSEQGTNLQLEADAWHLRTTGDGNTMEPTGLNFRVNTGQTLMKTNFNLEEQRLEQPHLKSSTPVVVDLSEVGKPLQPAIYGNLINDPVYRRLGTGDSQYFLEANFDIGEKKWETINSEHASAVDAFTEGSSNVRAIEWNLQEPETVNAENVSTVDAYCEDGNHVKVIEWNELGLEKVNAVLVTEGNAFSEGGNNVKVVESNRQELGIITGEHVSEMDTFSEGGNSVKLINWNQRELESQNSDNVSQVDTFSEGGNGVQVIEWNQLDDIDSGTENFVDALNTIESESESDFEAEMRKEVKTGPKDELGQNAVNGQTSEITSHVEPGNQSLSTSYDRQEGGAEHSERSTNSVSSANTWSPKDELGENVINGQTSEITSHVAPKHQRLTTSYYCKEGPEDLEVSTTSVSSVNTWSPKDELGKNVVDGQTSETSNVQPKHQRLTTSYDCKEGQEVLDRSTTPVSSTNVRSPDHTWSTHDKSESSAAQKMDASTCLSEEQPVQSSRSAILSNVPQGTDIGANDPVKSVETAVCQNAKAGFDATSDEKTTCAPHMSQEVSVQSSTSDPVAFWTNGTLFGLAPSKPIVFNMPDSVDSAPTSNGDKGSQRSLDAIQKVNPVGTLASSINKSELGNKLDDHCQDSGSSNHLFHQRLESTAIGHDKINLRDRPVMLDPSVGDAMSLESTVQVGTHVRNVSSEATNASEDRSSLLSVFSRGLLKNGLRRSGSQVYNETHEGGNPMKTNEFDNECQNTISHSVPETNLKGKLNSPVHSPPPSPPLEHMKISFQPVDGFDMSRLKLKYPEGVDQYENTLDAFPTFQLVPESTKLQHDIGSDSDDDTFCRSYACMSDESNSHMSDSNSEQWESSNSTESNDHTLYNGLHRISSSKSASVSLQLEEVDHGNIHVGSGSVSDEHSLSNPSFGLPTLDVNNPIGFQEMKLGLNRALDSSHLQEQTHEPPPLPPMQWRVSRLMFDEVQDNQYQGPDILSQSFVPKLSNSAIAQVDSAKLVGTTQESPTVAIPQQQVEVQKNGQQQTYHAEKEKGIDDKGDFLHQIRTKSFNLKRTEPTRSTYTPSSATSNKITAILQKANAIRQAVGSDDGEDDSWSDA